MNPPLPDADVQAMERMRNDDADALNEIMQRWSSRISSFLTRHTGSRDTAMDLSQELFVIVWRSRAKYRPTSAFSSWLFGIAANLARQHHRWRKRHPWRDNASLPEESSDQTPGDDLLQRERSAAVRKAIQALPLPLREVVLLSEYEGLRHREIADSLHCSPKAVETRLARAKTKLRQALQRWM